MKTRQWEEIRLWGCFTLQKSECICRAYPGKTAGSMRQIQTQRFLLHQELKHNIFWSGVFQFLGKMCDLLLCLYKTKSYLLTPSCFCWSQRTSSFHYNQCFLEASLHSFPTSNIADMLYSVKSISLYILMWQRKMCLLQLILLLSGNMFHLVRKKLMCGC